MMKTRKLFQLACRQSPFDLRLHPMRLPTARPMTTFGVFDDKEKAAETRYVKEKEKEYLQYRREEKIIAQKKELQLILGEGLFEACKFSRKFLLFFFYDGVLKVIS
jgi:hypothetical protein